MNRGQLPTKYLSDSNWGAFDHASHAPQLLSDNCYYVCVYVCVTVWYNYGGRHKFMKTMERMYTLAPQLGTFNITHIYTHTQWEKQ